MMNLKSPKPKWLILAEAEIGEHEIDGSEDNPAIMAYYADAGHPEIRHDEISWCAAMCCAMIERAGYQSPKTLAARGFLRWGKKLNKPKIGCICVFSRGDPRGWQGHVGFYVGEEDGQILLLGGNQSDAVSITHMPKSRLLGFRWPVTATNSRTSKGVIGGAVGTVATGVATVTQIVATSPDQSLKIGAEMKGMGIPWVAIAGSIITITALGIIAWAHFDDLRKNGK